MASTVQVTEAHRKSFRTSATSQPAVAYGCASYKGRVRENNEDSFGAAPEMNLFVVSDGMGGHACGEVASRVTVDTVIAYCREAEANQSLALVGERIAGASQTANRLASSVRLANQYIHRLSPGNEKMGSTVVAVRWTDERMSIVHVGDSRVYRLRGGNFEQLTEDHSLIAEQVRRGYISKENAQTSSVRNVLMRAVGVESAVEVDVIEHVMTDSDTILLCTDGLTNELSDVQIGSVLENINDAQEAADRLVKLADEAGGGDNLTAIVLRQTRKMSGRLLSIGRFGKWLAGI